MVYGWYNYSIHGVCKPTDNILKLWGPTLYLTHLKPTKLSDHELHGTTLYDGPNRVRLRMYALNEWIGLRENLQETMVFTVKYGGFQQIFP